MDFRKEYVQLKDKLHAKIAGPGAKSYTWADMEFLGGAASFLNYLRHMSRGEGYDTMKKLRHFLLLMHMYQSNHEPVYLEFAECELEHAEKCFEHISDAGEKSKLQHKMDMAKELHSKMKMKTGSHAYPMTHDNPHPTQNPYPEQARRT